MRRSLPGVVVGIPALSFMPGQRVQTGHGNEFGTDFTRHLRDLGIAHRHIPPGCSQANGKDGIWERGKTP